MNADLLVVLYQTERKKTMALYIHYTGLKHYNEVEFKKVSARAEADSVGHVLMALCVDEISRKTMPEILFRIRFLDLIYQVPFLKNNPSNGELVQLFERNLGLKIEVTNRGWITSLTRKRWMNRKLGIIERKAQEKSAL